MRQGTKQQLTTRGLASLEVGAWANDAKPHGAGQLQARKLAGGEIAFYYRYTGPDKKQVRVPLGTGLSLAEARDKAAALSKRYQSGERDLRAALDAEARELQRQLDAMKRTSDAEQAKAAATLGALLTAYTSQLERDGKASARAVKLTIVKHVEKAWPALWTTPAADVTTDDLLAVVARVADFGHLREAAKLRSYLRAAYAAAIRARQSAQGMPALRALKLTTNPASDLVTIEGASQPRDRALTVAELRAYWKHITALPGSAGAALRFHLLTGGQRVQQLARLTIHDYDRDVQCVGLSDGKGRRKTARRHDVPLIPAAREALADMGSDLGPFLFTLTRGASAISYESLRDHIVAIMSAMDESGELERGAFTVGDLRRTVETRLAAEGVSMEVRAQLQSHGLGGVQSRHYDKHSYLDEKRAALETLHRLVTGVVAKVTPIRRKKAG